MKSIAVLPQGSVSHEALLHLFNGEPVKIVHHKLISDVFLSTAGGTTDYSVIPIENTIEGSVSLHIDWLINEVDLPMQAEWIFPSIQNLIGHPLEFRDTNGNKDFTKIKKSFRILLQWHNACNLFGSMHLGLNWSRSEAPLKLLKSLRTILTRAGLRLVLLLAQQLMGWRLLIGKLQITTTTTHDLSLSVRRRLIFHGAAMV